MRDWLALPITDTLPSQDDEQTPLVEEENSSNHASGWLSLLAAFGLSSKIKRNIHSPSRAINNNKDTVTDGTILQLVLSDSEEAGSDGEVHLEEVYLEEESLEEVYLEEEPSEVHLEEEPSEVHREGEVPLQVNREEVPLKVNKEQVNKEEVSLQGNREEVPLHVNREEVTLHVNREEVPLKVNKEQVNREEAPLHVNREEVPLHVNREEVPLHVNREEVPLKVNKQQVNREEVLLHVNREDVQLLLHQKYNDMNDMNDDIHSRRSSLSSTISTTDTDNSTPAHSEIISQCDQKYLDEYHEHIITTKIYWNHGGKSVQITGEFDNWSASIHMEPSTEKPNSYMAEIPVHPTKDMEYKFVVDGEWRYAADLPHRTDWHGNINNVIYRSTV